jgi:uncharacterized protein (DUF934 family)
MPKLIDLSGNMIEDSTVASSKVWQLKSPDELILEGIPSHGLDRPHQLLRVEIYFESFTDGRGYSVAKLLRDRYHFTMDIRATGDVTIDQLGYLKRCGFTTFALRDDQDVPIAKQYLSMFSTAYQKTHPITPSIDTNVHGLNYAR